MTKALNLSTTARASAASRNNLDSADGQHERGDRRGQKRKHTLEGSSRRIDVGNETVGERPKYGDRPVALLAGVVDVRQTKEVSCHVVSLISKDNVLSLKCLVTNRW